MLDYISKYYFAFTFLFIILATVVGIIVYNIKKMFNVDANNHCKFCCEADDCKPCDNACDEKVEVIAEGTDVDES